MKQMITYNGKGITRYDHYRDVEPLGGTDGEEKMTIRWQKKDGRFDEVCFCGREDFPAGRTLFDTLVDDPEVTSVMKYSSHIDGMHQEMVNTTETYEFGEEIEEDF